jgi:hypothetical protein
VDGEVELACGGGNVGQLAERPDAPAGAAVRLLEHDDARRLEPVRNLRRRPHLLRGDPPCDPGQSPRDEARVNGRAAGLEDQDVGPLLGDEHRAGAGEHAQGDLVRHRGRRQEERRLVPEQLRRAPLQLVDHGILAHLLVADLRRGHRREHLWAGDRGRVGAEVDHETEPSVVRQRRRPVNAAPWGRQRSPPPPSWVG